MTFEEMQKEANRNAHEKGFWDGKDPVDQLPGAVALIHSEVSEALEEIRKPDLKPTEVYFTKDGKGVGTNVPLSPDLMKLAEEGLKPEGMVFEFADAVIRMMDNSEELGLDLATAIRIKQAYNRTRPHRHGGKRL